MGFSGKAEGGIIPPPRVAHGMRTSNFRQRVSRVSARDNPPSITGQRTAQTAAAAAQRGKGVWCGWAFLDDLFRSPPPPFLRSSAPQSPPASELCQTEVGLHALLRWTLYVILLQLIPSRLVLSRLVSSAPAAPINQKPGEKSGQTERQRGTERAGPGHSEISST